jgi:hypothetical protein
MEPHMQNMPCPIAMSYLLLIDMEAAWKEFLTKAISMR